METKNTLPNVLFYIKLIIFGAFLCSYFWLENIVTCVFFLIFVIAEFLEIVFFNIKPVNSKFEQIFEPVIGQTIVYMSLISMAISKVVTVGNVAIFIALDLMASFINCYNKRKFFAKWLQLLYFVANAIILAIIPLYFYSKKFAGLYVYLMYISILIYCVFIVVNSLSINKGEYIFKKKTKQNIVSENASDNLNDANCENKNIEKDKSNSYKQKQNNLKEVKTIAVKHNAENSKEISENKAEEALKVISVKRDDEIVE